MRRQEEHWSHFKHVGAAGQQPSECLSDPRLIQHSVRTETARADKNSRRALLYSFSCSGTAGKLQSRMGTRWDESEDSSSSVIAQAVARRETVVTTAQLSVHHNVDVLSNSWQTGSDPVSVSGGIPRL